MIEVVVLNSCSLPSVLLTHFKHFKIPLLSPYFSVVPPIPPAHPTPPEAEKVEMYYLSQLRQPQWPINGLYRTHYRAACNHFKRHADIKHIGKTSSGTILSQLLFAPIREVFWFGGVEDVLISRCLDGGSCCPVS